MDSYFSQVQILFNAEARNFVFLNIPRRYPGHGTLSPNYGALNANLSASVVDKAPTIPRCLRNPYLPNRVRLL